MIKKILILLFFVPIFAKAQIVDSIKPIIWGGDPPVRYLLSNETVILNPPDTSYGTLLIFDVNNYLKRIDAIKVTYKEYKEWFNESCTDGNMYCLVLHWKQRVVSDSSEYFFAEKYKLKGMAIHTVESNTKTYKKIPNDSIYQILTFTKTKQNEDSNKKHDHDAFLHKD